MKTATKFPSDKGLNFYSELRRRVNKDFCEREISPNANEMMWWKLTIFLSAFTMLYLLIIFSGINLFLLAICSLALGVTCAFIGFNVCHDAIHGSFSANKHTNQFISKLFYLVGANPYVWNITHNIIHHTYTNIPGHDEDIEIAPGLIRLCPEENLYRHHRLQHYYAFLLYGLASLSWVLRKDYKKFFQSSVGSRKNSHPNIEYFNLFFYKLLYYSLFFIVPIFITDMLWWQVLIGFLLVHLAQGFTMGLVFQLAHVVEDTTFPNPGKDGNMEESWAMHQMRTTANFATHSPLATFFLGGLNRQIEHHLFPKICHVHYGRIAIIVKQTAFEFGVPYHENSTFLSALRSHFKVLKKMGRP